MSYLEVEGVTAREPKSEDGVHIGDAFDLIRGVDKDSVDLILTSPPYWGLRSYGLDHEDDVLAKWKEVGCAADRVPPYDWYRNAGGLLGLEPYPHWYIAHLVEFFVRTECRLKQDGSLWVNLGDTYFASWSSIRDGGGQGFKPGRLRRRTPSGGHLRDKQLLLIPARFAIAMQEAGWILRNDLIWAKPNVIPRPESDRLRLSHEHWFHFVKRNPRGRPRYFYDLDGCEEGARDVVVCGPSRGRRGHTATFPSEVVRPRILSSTRPGALVLDPFCGTGQALLDALDTGRRALGFELSEHFAETARERISNLIASDILSEEREDSARCMEDPK